MYIRLFKESVLDNWPMLAIFFVTIISIRIFYIINHRGKHAFYKEFFYVIGLLYILILFELLTNSEANVGGGYNIMPFSEITRYTFGSNLFMLNVIGNILIFIPFGFFVSEYIKPKKIFSPLIIAIIVSVCVEFVQLHIGRSFDIDDIILNLVGSIIGYLIYAFLNKIRNS